MYEATPDAACLRQGDIIAGIYLPRYAITDDFHLLHALDPEGNPTRFCNRAILKVEKRFAVVLSQCCEFNEGKRNAFSLGIVFTFREVFWPRRTFLRVNLAEVVPLKKSALSRIPVDQIRLANKIDPAKPNAAVNTYLFEADGVHFQEPFVADFTQVFSVRMDDRAKVLRSKILQLDNQHRRDFQKKLGYFYARPAQ
jgi:hypothetical protein